MIHKNRKVLTCICILIGILILAFYGCKRPEPVCNDKYTEIKGNRLYYTDNVSQEDIDALLDYLDFNKYYYSYVKLDKSDSNHYFVYFYVSEHEFNDKASLEYYQVIAENISGLAFNQNKVTVYLCNDKFEPQKTFDAKIFPTNSPDDTFDDTVN